jgi:hypothetical protein
MLRKRFIFGLLSALFFLPPLYGQFSASLQGTVEDTTGAVVPQTVLVLTSSATKISQTTISGENGNFRFVSLAPGMYQIVASAKGFASHRMEFSLSTGQTLSILVPLSISGQKITVEVTDQAPVVDVAESSSQLTISTEAFNSLPLAGRDLLGLTSLAAGVTGLGITASGGNGQSNDNYAAETQVSASANGRSSVGNSYVIDGLDVTSNITPGVLNLVPNADTVQEAAVQTNAFTAEYGRSSSIVEIMTTRSGGDKFHFMASDYYTADWLTSRTEFQPKETATIVPFHSNTMSTFLGGPVPFLKKTYFFTGWEPLLALTQSNSSTTYESPEFRAWAKTTWPDAIGTQLLNQYPATNASTTSVAKYGKDLYKSTCGTAAAAYIPCDLPIIDNGTFNATNSRNALQYNFRLDKYFSKDRIYANYYRTGLDTGGPSIRLEHGAPEHYIVRSIQGNETHTFNQNTINEASFGFLRMEGLIHEKGPFHVPIITVSSGWSTQLGVSKAHEDYVQHHTVWHEAVTHIHGTHSIRVGYQGFHGDNLTYFGQWYSQPAFSFASIGDFLQGNVYTESGVSYFLSTGKLAGLQGGSYQFTGNSTGIYGQDIWRATKSLTLTFGLRWDDFGNPSPSNGSVESNFFYGAGDTISDQVANGSVQKVSHALNNSMKTWSPRVGVAYDLTGKGHWLVRGGFGLYHDWLTLGNVQNEFGNPPAATAITFYGSSGIAPVYNVGTSDTYPFGFTYPTISAYGTNSKGGITGVQSSIAGNDPNLKPTNTLNYTATLEHSFGLNFSLAASYSGSHSNNLYTDFAGHTTNAYYGVDVNNFPGSLIANNGNTVRLNTSFGSIRYTVNGPTSTYNAFITELKGRFLHHGFIDASYTHSSSWDDAYTYPTVQSNSGDYAQYWAHSAWDVPNRFSLQVAYELPALKRGPRLLHVISNGWKPSAVAVLQSGTPFTVLETNTYKNGGDYNADGTNSDLPNVPSFGYTIPTDRKTELKTGVFKTSDFTAPTTKPAEGNEKMFGYRNPGYTNTDFALLKNTAIRQGMNFQLRLEVFNLFNRANLGGISASTTSSSFGKSTSQYNARFLQLGTRFEF